MVTLVCTNGSSIQGPPNGNGNSFQEDSKYLQLGLSFDGKTLKTHPTLMLPSFTSKR